MLNLFDPSRSLFLSDECPKNTSRVCLFHFYFFAIVLCHPAAARLTQVHFNASLMLRCFFRALVEEVGPSEGVLLQEEQDCCLKDALRLEFPSFNLTVDFSPWSCCIVNVAVYFR